MENVPQSCPGPNTDNAGKTSSCQGCPNQQSCASGIKAVDPAIDELKEKLASMRHKIAIMSCKGGVGKTSMAVQLARHIAKDELVNVGLLDTDITGPSLPVMMNLLDHEIHITNQGWTPVYPEDNLAVISASFMVDSADSAVIWGGSQKNDLIKKFLLRVDWADTEYLIVDTPPGTTDEHFALQEYLNKTVELDGAVLVTTPHESSQDGLRRIINMCGKFGIHIIGVIENMAQFSCPKCQKTSGLFGCVGVTRQICEEFKVPFLGSIPLEGDIVTLCGEGKPYYDLIETSPAAQQMDKIFEDIVKRVSRKKYGVLETTEPEPTTTLVGTNDSQQQPPKDEENNGTSEDEVATTSAPYEPTSIKNVVMVMSGKGGVGKTTMSVQIALALERKGFKVGLLDADVCGPSAPTVLNLKNKSVYSSEEGWIPVYCGSNKNLAVMSTGFFMEDKNTAFIWRGPKKAGMIQRFLSGVCWGSLDYLVVDTPPGTSDEHLACIQSFKEFNVNGAILVTTPQGVSLADVRRQVTFCNKAKLEIVGVLENLAGYSCPECSEITNIFSKDGAKKLTDYFKIPFLGSIPICSNPLAPMGLIDDILDKHII